LTKRPDQWDLNVQAVQDAKRSIVESKTEYARLLQERAQIARELRVKGVQRVLPGEHPEFDALGQRALLAAAISWACVGDLNAARERFKNGDGC
jgi:hypothetical protein